MSFIDLHCHMAWDIDDGIDSREEAEKALQQAKADGIVTLAVTPHFIPGAQKEADVREMNQRIRELKELGKGYGCLLYTSRCVYETGICVCCQVCPGKSI